MKYGTKPNQSLISQPKLFKTKYISTIKIDVSKKTIELIQIENTIEAVRAVIGCYNIERINIENSNDCVLISNDPDILKKDFFIFNDLLQKIYSNAIVLKINSRNELDNFQRTKIQVEDLKKIIQFN